MPKIDKIGNKREISAKKIQEGKLNRVRGTKHHQKKNKRQTITNIILIIIVKKMNAGLWSLQFPHAVFLRFIFTHFKI
jgi:hypothetical protein